MIENDLTVQDSKKDKWLNWSFLLFLLLILVMRAVIFFKVNLPCIDSDQPFMWAGVKDYAEGHFYEPRFYGQDYNTFMEALFAVPLYWLHVPVYYALPIATHVITLFPFLFTAFYLFRKNKKENALLVLGVLLCLTTGYDILSGIPRGFVTGLFFTSFFVINLLDPHKLRFILLNTVLAVIGYFVNPNSIVVSLPFLFYLFLHNFNNKRYYYVSIAGAFSFIPFYFLFNWFYKLHPSYVILGLNYDFTTAYFWQILGHLDAHFAHISFFVEERCAILLLMLALLGFLLFRQNKKGFFIFLGFIACIFLSFFSAKTMDGVVWPFYSYSRMFLGIPVMIVLLLALLNLRSKYTLGLVLIICLGSAAWKFYDLDKKITYHTKVESRWNGVHLISLTTVKDALNFYGASCKNHQVDHFLISNAFWVCTYMNYGGQVIQKDFPTTEETKAERRYWVREGNKDKVFRRFIFLSTNYNLDKAVEGKYKFSIQRLDDYGLFLIEQNQVMNKDFIALVNQLE